MAAVLVLFHHCYTRIGGRLELGHGGELRGTQAPNPFYSLMSEGHTGVALFMVLSGFIFTHIAYGQDIRYGPFLLNRVLRIYPLLLAIFAVACTVYYPLVSVSDVVAVLAIPFQIKGVQGEPFWLVPELYPFTTLFWTISPEFQFYLVFPFLLLLLVRLGPSTLLLLIGLTLAVRFTFVFSQEPFREIFYFSIVGRFDQFLIGMLAALVYRRLSDVDLRPLAYICAGLAVLMLFGFNRAGTRETEAVWRVLWPTLEALIWSGFIIGYLQAAQALPATLSRVLASVGEISFSIYLLHVVVIALVMQIGPFSFGLGPAWAVFLNGLLFVLPITLALSWLTFKMIEQPFLKLRVTYVRRGNAQPEASTR